MPPPLSLFRVNHSNTYNVDMRYRQYRQFLPLLSTMIMHKIAMLLTATCRKSVHNSLPPLKSMDHSSEPPRHERHVESSHSHPPPPHPQPPAISVLRSTGLSALLVGSSGQRVKRKPVFVYIAIASPPLHCRLLSVIFSAGPSSGGTYRCTFSPSSSTI